jgi:hypothetical protein
MPDVDILFCENVCRSCNPPDESYVTYKICEFLDFRWQPKKRFQGDCRFILTRSSKEWNTEEDIQLGRLLIYFINDLDSILNTLKEKVDSQIHRNSLEVNYEDTAVNAILRPSELYTCLQHCLILTVKCDTRGDNDPTAVGGGTMVTLTSQLNDYINYFSSDASNIYLTEHELSQLLLNIWNDYPPIDLSDLKSVQ